MKATFVSCGVLGVLLLAASPAMAQDAGAPKLVLSQDSWDFGAVWHPEKPTLNLSVRNEGTADLKIKEVRTTCGCTAAQPSRYELKPGETTEIRVQFDTTGKQGEVSSKVIIASNDPQRPEVNFDLKGVVKRVVTRTPLGGLVIKSLDPKPGQTGTIRLENNMSEPMKPEIKSCSLKGVDLEIKEITAGQVYDIIGRTAREFKIGTVRGEIVVKTGLEREAEMSLPARVQTVGSVELSPAAILLLKKPEPVTRQVSLHYYGKNAKEFRVTKTECKDERVKINFGGTLPPEDWMTKITPPITAVVNAQVTIPPGEQIPAGGITVDFHTTDPENPVVQLLITTDKPAFELRMYGPMGEAKNP